MLQITPYFTFIWTSITSQMATANTALIGSLQIIMSGWFIKLVPAYLVILLFIAMWSGEELAILRFWRQVLLAAIVYTLVSSLAMYQEWVAGVVHGTMNALTAQILGATQGASVPESFGHIATKCFAIGIALAKAVPNAATYGEEALLAMAVVMYFLVATLIIGCGFSLYLIASVLTDYGLAYGPVFITMYFFEPTYPFFDGWFRTIIAGMLVQLFLAGDLAMMIVTMNGYMALIAPAMNPGGTNAATGDIGFMLWDTFGVLIMLSLFALLAGISIYLAVSISGGAHHQLVRLPRPGGGGGGTPRVPTPSSDSGGGGGSVEPSGSAGGGGTPRAYAFQNSVGSAP